MIDQMRKLEKSLFEEEELPKLPRFVDVVTGRAEVSDIGRYVVGSGKNMVKRKIRDFVYGEETQNQEYLFVKDIVRRYLNGEDFGLSGQETTLDDMDGNLGFHIGDRYKIPKTSEIPKIFGEAYKSIAERFTGSDLEEATKRYIEIHEIAETLYQAAKGIQELSNDEHGRFEAYVQKALKTMRFEKPEAWEIYKACLAVNSQRPESDSFKQAMDKYHPELNEDIVAVYS